MTIEWWLVRHGITAWNAERRYQGHSDPPLLPGEASGLAELRGELAGVSFAAAYASDLRRCRETLAYARPDLVAGVRRDPRLRELNFGEWEGKTYDMLKEDGLYRAWLDDPGTATPPGGESWQAFQARVTDMCGELMAHTVSLMAAGCGISETAGLTAIGGERSPAKGLAAGLQPAQSIRLLVVTHGGFISMLCTLLQPGLGFWDTRVGPGGVKRLCFNKIGEPDIKKEGYDD